MICKKCGSNENDCRFPVSHGLPTIDSVTLPGSVNQVASRSRYNGGNYGKKLTAADREILNAVNIHN